MKPDERRKRLFLVTMLTLLIVLLTRRSRGDEPGTRPSESASAASAPAAATQPASAPAIKKIPLSFNNAPLNEIAKFLNKQLGKPVLVSKEVEKTQITLINPDPLTEDEAMYVLTTALHAHGIAMERRERTLHLIPISQIAQSQLRSIGPEEDLAGIKPANEIVRKIFKVSHYDPAKLVDVIKPLMPDFGHITADPGTGKLIVVSTVERLMQIADLIEQVDNPDVSGGELRVFAVKHVDVHEIVPMLERLIAGYLGVEVKSASISGGAPAELGLTGRRVCLLLTAREAVPRGAAPPVAGSGAVMIKAEKTPALIIPDPRRSSIVVASSGNVLKQIEGWLAVLDQPKPPSAQTEFAEVRFGDAEALANELRDLLNNMLDDSLRNAVRIIPFATSRRIMLVGSEENRRMVKEWLTSIDVADVGVRATRTFTLKYADAEQVAKNIKELFSGDSSSRRYYYYYESRRGSSDTDRSQVTVTANTRSNSITLIASPEKMERIAKQIEEWDRPLQGEAAAPRIYTLKYADPDKTKALLESLFTKKESGTQMPYWWYDEMPEQVNSPVGRLFGQFTFEAYPETGKLIVVSKSEENYGVIDDMIREIDSPRTIGLPRIIELKFADAETLAEQLNALLNAPGTPTSILRRGETGKFEQFSDESSPYSTQQQQQQRPGPERGAQEDLKQMTFWWQQSPPDIKVKQPSNLVGKIRIVPNVEQNLLMVAASEEYSEAVDTFIRDLDKPGHQVLIKAIIAEITHDDATSLGYRFSTDPSAFITGDPLLTENALRGLLTYNFEDMFGRQNTVTFDMDVNNLLSLLGKVTDLKIRSEPKILTADNVEAEFFDGQDIPFISRSQSTEVGSVIQSFDYFPVGITLRVRPHITKEESPHIDLTVKVRISTVVPGRTLFGGAVVDRRETTTRIVLEDGQTFMISGILRSEQREIIRRIPGAGDIPILGEIFKHRELGDVNTELLIFLTPHVIGPGRTSPIQRGPLDRLDYLMGPKPPKGSAPASMPAPPPEARRHPDPDADASSAVVRK